MAMGARKAFEECSDLCEQLEKMPFLGCDGLPTTGQAWVREKRLAATIFIPPNADLAIEMMAQSIATGTLPLERTYTTAKSFPAFDVLEQEPERIERLWDNARYFKAGLVSAGFNTGISETPITPVIVGDAALAHQLSRELFQEGVLATGIAFPTVAKGKARVRTIVAATHTREDLNKALEAFGKVGRKLGLI